jgi:hypothetical protein
MTDSAILMRFGTRAGFTLVKVAEIGLPVFRVQAGCLVVETTPTSLVEEYILRALTQGLSERSQLRDLLGLPERVLLAKLADMLRNGYIAERQVSGAALELSITPTGRILLEERKTVRPKESELSFTYDGLTHRTAFIPDQQLLKPKQVKAAGIPELSPIPVKGPEPSDLDVSQITTYLRDARSTNSRAALQVLKVIRVDRRERLFLPASVLIFRATSGDEYQVAFVIDGRLSQEHEQAFRRKGGIERSAIFAALRSGQERLDLEQTVGSELATILKEAKPSAVSTGRPILSIKKDSAKERSRTDHIREAVRQLSVAEHNPLMMRALGEAAESLIIVSPWIRREVVNEEFLTELRAALSRNVRVTIGYGIKSGRYDEDIDVPVKREFDRLSNRFDNFVVKRLGDTHAKILVKDREFFVVTSFNWLSFRGDPDKQFREEWGTIVESRGLTEDFLKQQLYPRLGLRWLEEDSAQSQQDVQGMGLR